ncbi:MAG: hypothetical protein LBO72_07450 [Helicobacteraceae bacterium]|jgi:hypothetical protein|nr:hypothetical protein [Helicobacteraceae bacterium]
MKNSSVAAGAAITHALLSIRARKKTAAAKAIYATQGAIAIFCAAETIDKLKANETLKAIAIAAIGGAAIAALNKLEEISNGK